MLFFNVIPTKYLMSKDKINWSYYYHHNINNEMCGFFMWVCVYMRALVFLCLRFDKQNKNWKHTKSMNEICFHDDGLFYSNFKFWHPTIYASLQHLWIVERTSTQLICCTFCRTSQTMKLNVILMLHPSRLCYLRNK